MQRQRVNVCSVYEQLAKLKYSGDTGPDPGQDEDEDMDPSQSSSGQRRNTLVISPLERQHSGNRFR